MIIILKYTYLFTLVYQSRDDNPNLKIGKPPNRIIEKYTRNPNLA